MLQLSRLNFSQLLSKVEPIDDFRNQYSTFIALHQYWLIMMSLDFALVALFGEQVQVIDRAAFVAHAVCWHIFYTRRRFRDIIKRNLSKLMLVWALTYIIIQIWNASTIYLQLTEEVGFIRMLAMTVAATARLWAMLIVPMVTFSWVEQKAMLYFPVLAAIPLTLAGGTIYQEFLQPVSLISYFLITTLTLLILSRYLNGRLQFENNKLQAANSKLAEIQSEKNELAIEVERARISRELHDTLSNSIGAALIHVRSANLTFDIDEATFRNHLTEAETLLRQELISVRNVIHALRPTSLAEYGLKHAIEHLSTNELKARGFVVEWNYSIETSLPPSVERALIYISREAITNVVRHSKANLVEICLQESTDHWCLEIHDDGIGGIPELDEINSYGIRGIYERVRLLGGTFNISSTLETGTTIAIALPK